MSDFEVTLTNVRLAFPDLFEPTAMQAGQELKYKSVFLAEKGSRDDKAVNKAIEECAIAKWGKKAESVLKSIQGNPNKFCYRDGDIQSYDGYEGHMSLSASNKKRPTVVDRDRTPLSEKDGKPYAGCYVNAKVQIWAQDNQHGKAMRCSLLGVQFYADGDSFGGGRTASADEFEDLSVDDDNSDLM